MTKSVPTTGEAVVAQQVRGPSEAAVVPQQVRTPSEEVVDEVGAQRIPVGGSMSSRRAELVVADPVVAGVAVRAALDVPGVVRVEHGLRGLVAAFNRAGKQLWSGYELASTKGVRVHRNGGVLAVELELSIAAGQHAGALGAEVQDAVMRTVRAQTGVRVDEVSVTIIDIEPEAR
ncbi:Asp23/Gls24 family envelope stress response protein [Nocardia sp. NPDC058058]|uniref:Asp23/Gls24 family envelope stress response protein n=1 Tax=Nocardia sp. NPDC058058 TaxID=3346317 RepID=UPI0036DF5284